ncbi:MAG TPA: glycosyltransferase family 4 protein [Ktedonobacteraceae bacterium]|nr:glycosyltransferase family 4 protein [Ktedonobacteraceae bacterium]
MQKVRKVLLIVENVSVTSDPRVWSEATTLRDAGCLVSVICPKGTKQREDKESYSCIEDIHIYRYRLPEIHRAYLSHILEYSVALVMSFLLSIKVWFRHGFDVIHVANPPDMFFLIGLFYRCFRKKFVYDQHDLTPELFQVIFNKQVKPLHRFLRLLERCSYQTAHLVITTNTSFQRFAIERGRCPAEKVFVVRNGPDLKLIESVPQTTELPFPGMRRYVLAYIGVMGKQDGVEYILYALHDLVYKRGRQDISALLMGDGSITVDLRNLAHELKLDEYIVFTGWLEKRKALSYLAAADVGLIPDPKNGLNEYCTMIKAMEYMAMGLPIVSFDLKETHFSARQSALYAKPNEVEDFANAIETLLENETLRKSMAEYGQKRIADVLSWEHSRKNLLAAYETLFPGISVIAPADAVIEPPLNYDYAAAFNSTRPE